MGRVSSIDMYRIGICTTYGAQKMSAVVRRLIAPISWQFSEKLKTVPSHALVWFADSTHKHYFEALEGEGWRGPRQYSRLVEWEKKEDERWVRSFELTEYFTRNEIINAYAFAERMLEYWTYSIKQLPFMLRIMGLGRELVGATPREVVCSEACSRVCCSPRFDLREWTGKKDHDWINPFVLQQALKKATE